VVASNQSPTDPENKQVDVWLSVLPGRRVSAGQTLNYTRASGARPGGHLFRVAGLQS